MRLHLFNPENDLALANGDPNFVAPASARKLAEDLALLPQWWSDEADRMFVESQVWKNEPIDACAPWGWSAASRQRFLKAGIDSSVLPAEARIAHIRMLSHRRTGILLLQQLQQEVALPELPVEITSVEEIEAYVATHPAGAVFKTPWSSSGKGLCWSNRMNAFNRAHWFSSVFRKMGSVIAEPVYDRLIDFAMLFSSESGIGVRFVGYSLFQTDEQGVYVGNKLLSNEAIRMELIRYVEPEVLDRVIKRLESILSDLISDAYEGFLGVDMMIVRNPQSEGYGLHPCVELNLRMTMGMVARLFYDKHLEGTTKENGVFRIVHSSVKGELYERFGIPNGQDQLLLTPVNLDTQYAAVVTFE
ncbi:MAG: hypothetical protein RR455_10835 [Bacteroidales bacterium]